MKSLNHYFERLFYKLGWNIALFPKTFVIVPIIATALIGLGFIQFKINNDFVYLYSTEDGPTVKENENVIKYFKQDENGKFDLSRKSSVGQFIRYDLHRKSFHIHLHRDRINYNCVKQITRFFFLILQSDYHV